MQNYINQTREWMNKNPFYAGYAVGCVASIGMMSMSFRMGQKMLLLRLKLASQKNQGL